MKGRRGEQRCERQRGTHQLTIGHQSCSSGEHRERAQPHQCFDQSVLDRLPASKAALQIAQQAAALRDFRGAHGAVIEGGDRTQALHAIDGVRGDFARRFAQRGAEVSRLAHCQHRRQRHCDQERQQDHRQRWSEEAQRDQHAARHEDGHEQRRDRVRVEQLDQLHIAEQRTDQVAAPSSHEVRGCEGIQHAVQADAELRE